MNRIEKLAYRAKEILGSKIAELNNIEAKAFLDLEEYFKQKSDVERRAHDEECRNKDFKRKPHDHKKQN